MPVKIYPFKQLDPETGQEAISNYYATTQAITLLGGTIIDRSTFYYVSMDDLDEDGKVSKDRLIHLLSK